MNRNLLAIFTGIATTSIVVQQVLAQPSNRSYLEARQSIVLIENITTAIPGAPGVRQGTGFIVTRDNNT